VNRQPRDPYAGTAEELRERLRALTEEVQRNELLLRKTQEREVELLRAHSLGELFDRVVTGLRTAYGLDLVTLSLFDPQHELRHLSANENLSSAVMEEVRYVDSVSPLAPRLAQFDRPWLGAFDAVDHELFISPSFRQGSIALIPLPRDSANHADSLRTWLPISSRTWARWWRSAWRTRSTALGWCAAASPIS
jgi:two-component system, cell cycle response regulator